MASTSVQGITSSSSSSPPLYMHDVFLSFRGKDTRNNFTSHLYSNLKQRGIDVYMDDRELERGKPIEPALWKAIEESRFSVIIFSRDYASSPWCLDELVKIVQCMKEMGQTVLPVFYDVDPSEFYDVDPSEVTERKRKYEEAFGEHEQNFKENLEKVQNWKDCLSTVANLSGWDVRNSFTIPELQQQLKQEEELLEQEEELQLQQVLQQHLDEQWQVRQVLRKRRQVLVQRRQQVLRQRQLQLQRLQKEQVQLQLQRLQLQQEQVQLHLLQRLRRQKFL